MAIFGDIATIRTCIEPFTCIFPSLTPYGQDKIIFSESKHLAVLYDLNTCLPIKCWTFSELDSLVAPLIYDHVNEKFVAVKQLKVALYKCDSEDDLVQVRLGKSIHCLLASPIKESLVLFKNGFVRPLGSVIAEKGKFPGDGIIPESEEIIKTTINQFNPESSWVALLTKTQNCFNKLYMIKADFINGLGNFDAKYTVKQNYKCLTMTKSGKPIGLTENGNIHLLDIDGDQLLLSLRDSITISALCLPEEDTLAVVVREGETYSLKIVNLKFKVITSQLPLDIVPIPDFISQSNGKLFIASPKAMLCIQYEIKPATLASVMGKNFVPNNKSCKQQPSSDHIFLDSSTDIKITTLLTDGIP
ncbi:uncharacterized protein LOC107371132 [Tetranychus urticae]|uniref:uncharacterized protein LOC107371132 n=1 Tax=Tetranychus urticae TaxID=32264 RepID=UPI00077B9C03|nr:uncharacterized protein LOC107371132 [Tetranychus urticae]